ncbi:MAG: carboxylating nicotinate-nucleotide diphosphorylase [Candidatus Dadabacteria bacterium]|nr:MAG: carboxylating nicotinate-nucleotide diphosphorylase [Candidatus Dadabacteria bacterium]
MNLRAPLIKRLIKLAIDEDLQGGDITTELTVLGDVNCEGLIVAREDFTVCGLELIPVIYEVLGWSVECEFLSYDGRRVKAEEILVRLRGNIRHLLSSERIVLNFLQRLSGVATYTREVVSKAGRITVMDTRKTTPGWRLLEKYAVKVGGGRNHRASLGELILVKNNHIDFNEGSLTRTLERVKDGKPPFMPVEVEVRTQAELKEALDFCPDIVMLDNMDDEQIRAALKLVNTKAPDTLVEVSGGITPERFAELEKLGVKYVSIGALTNKATSVDISMRLGEVQ